MSGSLREINPHGQGNTLASRADRANVVDGLSTVTTRWAPFPHQARMLGAERGIVVAVGGLGSGKSEPGALMLLRWALRHPRREDGRPTKWYVIGPDFSLIRQEQFEKILEHARRLTNMGYESVVKRVVFGQDPRIYLAHDQVILGRSGTEPNRLRGHEVDGFWLDEGQNQSEKAFRIAVSRLRSTSATRVVVTASPEDSPGWIWRLINGKDPRYNEVRRRLLEEGPGSGLRVYRWTSADNLANKTGVLATVRAVLEASADGTAAQELEGRFPGTPEAPAVGVFDYGHAFVAKLVLSAREAQPAVLGVDIGESHDFTWITVLSATGVVLYMERWNASSPGVRRDQFYSHVEERVLTLAERWHVPLVVIDRAKAGVVIEQSLARQLASRVRVEGYATDAVGKKAVAIEALGVALSRGDVKVPAVWFGPDGNEQRLQHVEQLRKELSELVPVEFGQGKRKFDHPSGGHDDGIVSLALAWHGIATKRDPNAANLYGPLPPPVNVGSLRPVPRASFPRLKPNSRDPGSWFPPGL